MNSNYLIRLAMQSIDKHRQTYVPYMVAVSCFVSMFYLLLFLRDNIFVAQTINTTLFRYVLSLAVYAFGLFVVIFLIYCNNFLIRPRTKEFGLLYLFGLSQRHLLIIMGYEVVITYAVSIVLGLISGAVLSRLMSMVLSALINAPVTMEHIVDPFNMLVSAVLFMCVMCVIFVINTIQIILTKPKSLGRQVDGLKKTSWRHYLILFCGLLCIGYAYWMVVAVDSSQRAYEVMASVVLAVMIGTYCLFVSLSESVLHLLTRLPNVYYQKNNFIMINGLLNRVRFNAIGLASVAMFAFVILTMVSMAGVIYVGADESVQKMYAADVVMTVQEHNIASKPQLLEQITEVVSTNGVTASYTESYTFLSLSALQNGDEFTYQEQNRVFVGMPTSHYMVFVTVEEYNQIYNQSLVLAPDEVAVYSSYLALPDVFTLQGLSYRVVARLPPLSIANYDLEQLVNAHYVIVHDASVLAIHERQKYQQNNEFPSPIRYRIGINIDGTESQKLTTYQAIADMMQTNVGISQVEQFPNSFIEIINIQSRQAERVTFKAVYGTLLFLSLFLGVLFMLSTALLIYYKQLSEGYEDKSRFEILQRIGMTRDEVRASVDKQIVLLFFIPLVVAGLHFVMSLHLIEHLLELFRIESLQLLIAAALITLFAFSMLYLIIYRVSARVYYNIVR